jgi:hypothetical protein
MICKTFETHFSKISINILKYICNIVQGSISISFRKQADEVPGEKSIQTDVLMIFLNLQCTLFLSGH